MNPEISSGLSGGSEEDDPFACSNFTKDAQSPQLDQIQTNRSSFLPTGIDWKSEISLCERVTQAVFCFTQMCYSLPTVSQFLHEAQYYPRDDLSAKLEALALDLESQTSRALAHVCPSYSQHRISESYETRNISELGDTLYARYAGVPNVLRLVASEICKPDAPPIDSLIRHIESAIVSSIETTARNVAAALDDIASAQSLSSLAIPELVRSFPRAPTSVSAGLHTTDGGFIERYELAPPIEYVTVAMFIDTVDSLQGGLQQIEDYLAHEGSSPFGGFVDRAIQDLSAKFDLSNVDHLLQAALRKGNLSSYSLGEIDPRIEKRLLTLEISRLPIEQRQHIDIARCFASSLRGEISPETLRALSEISGVEFEMLRSAHQTWSELITGGTEAARADISEVQGLAYPRISGNHRSQIVPPVSTLVSVASKLDGSLVDSLRQRGFPISLEYAEALDCIPMEEESRAHFFSLYDTVKAATSFEIRDVLDRTYLRDYRELGPDRLIASLITGPFKKIDVQGAVTVESALGAADRVDRFADRDAGAFATELRESGKPFRLMHDTQHLTKILCAIAESETGLDTDVLDIAIRIYLQETHHQCLRVLSAWGGLNRFYPELIGLLCEDDEDLRTVTRALFADGTITEILIWAARADVGFVYSTIDLFCREARQRGLRPAHFAHFCVKHLIPAMFATSPQQGERFPFDEANPLLRLTLDIAAARCGEMPAGYSPQAWISRYRLPRYPSLEFNDAVLHASLPCILLGLSDLEIGAYIDLLAQLPHGSVGPDSASDLVGRIHQAGIPAEKLACSGLFESLSGQPLLGASNFPNKADNWGSLFEELKEILKLGNHRAVLGSTQALLGCWEESADIYERELQNTFIHPEGGAELRQLATTKLDGPHHRPPLLEELSIIRQFFHTFGLCHARELYLTYRSLSFGLSRQTTAPNTFSINHATRKAGTGDYTPVQLKTVEDLIRYVRETSFQITENPDTFVPSSLLDYEILGLATRIYRLGELSPQESLRLIQEASEVHKFRSTALTDPFGDCTGNKYQARLDPIVGHTRTISLRRIDPKLVRAFRVTDDERQLIDLLKYEITQIQRNGLAVEIENLQSKFGASASGSAPLSFAPQVSRSDESDYRRLVTGFFSHVREHAPAEQREATLRKLFLLYSLSDRTQSASAGQILEATDASEVLCGFSELLYQNYHEPEFSEALQLMGRGLAAELEQGLGLSVLGSAIDRLKKTLEYTTDKTTRVAFTPSRGAVNGLIGFICDSCVRMNLATTPDALFIPFSPVYDHPKDRPPTSYFQGGSIVLAARTTDGEEALIIRGFNPVHTLLMKVTPGELFEAFTTFVEEEIARPLGFRYILVPIDKIPGLACSNRPFVHSYVNSTYRDRKRMRLDDPDSVIFNNISVGDRCVVVRDLGFHGVPRWER